MGDLCVDRMDLRQARLDSVGSAQDSVRGCCKHDDEASGNLLASSAAVSFSTRTALCSYFTNSDTLYVKIGTNEDPAKL
jgi:hypothetical protein